MDDPRLMLLQLLLPAILLLIPTLLVMLVGVILALVFWRRNAKVSLLVIAALVLSFIVRAGSASQGALMPFLANTQGWGLQQIGWLTSCLSIVWSLLSAVALGLLLGAAFGWRKKDDAETKDSEFAGPA
jgi:hypothetical protein